MSWSALFLCGLLRRAIGLRNGLERVMCFNCGWKWSFGQVGEKMGRIFEQDEVVEFFE